MSRVPTVQWVVSKYGFPCPVNTGWTSWNRSLEGTDLDLRHQGDLLGLLGQGARAGDETIVDERAERLGTSLGWESFDPCQKCHAFLSHM